MSRPVETVEGEVELVNDRGVRVAGEWFNFSKFVQVATPKVGDRVRLGIDSKGFILSLDVDDDDRPVEIVLPDATAIRLQVLQSAATFGASRPDAKSTDVLKIADAWLQWVTEA